MVSSDLQKQLIIFKYWTLTWPLTYISWCLTLFPQASGCRYAWCHFLLVIPIILVLNLLLPLPRRLCVWMHYVACLFVCLYLQSSQSSWTHLNKVLCESAQIKLIKFWERSKSYSGHTKNPAFLIDTIFNYFYHGHAIQMGRSKWKCSIWVTLHHIMTYMTLWHSLPCHSCVSLVWPGYVIGLTLITLFYDQLNLTVCQLIEIKRYDTLD